MFLLPFIDLRELCIGWWLSRRLALWLKRPPCTVAGRRARFDQFAKPMSIPFRGRLREEMVDQMHILYLAQKLLTAGHFAAMAPIGDPLCHMLGKLDAIREIVFGCEPNKPSSIDIDLMHAIGRDIDERSDLRRRECKVEVNLLGKLLCWRDLRRDCSRCR